MENVVLSPAPGQTVVSANSDPYFNHNHHNQHHGGHGDETIALANYRALSAQADRNVMATGDRINTVGAAGALAAGHTDQLVAVGFDRTGERICQASKDITHGVSAGFTDVALGQCKTDDAIAEAKLSTAVGFKDSIIASNVGFAAATVQLSTLASAAQLEAAKNAAALSVEATKNANALSVEATKNFYALSLEAVKNAAASQLEAQKNAAAQLAATEKCCCEASKERAAFAAALTATVIAQGETTRGLITDNRIRELEQRLNRIPTGVAVTIPVGL